MNVIVIYDIVVDRLRNKVAEKCKDHGLTRVQFSAFTGDLDRDRRETLMKQLGVILGESKGNIRLYPICDKDMGLMKEISRGYDPEPETSRESTGPTSPKNISPDKGAPEKGGVSSEDPKILPGRSRKKSAVKAGQPKARKIAKSKKRKEKKRLEVPIPIHLPPIVEKLNLPPDQEVYFGREAILDLCGDEPQPRAIEYICSKRKIEERVFDGRQLTAKVWGTLVYDTRIVRLGNSAQGLCDCPSRKIPCKHVVALGHTWLREPASFRRPDGK